MPKNRFTVVAGREIHLDGRPFISVGREGDTRPYVADQAAHLIVRLLNRSSLAKKMAPDVYKYPLGFDE